MAISFNEIPIDLRVPGQYVEIDNTGALQGLPGIPVKILVIGQRLSTGGSVAAAKPVRVLDAAQAEAFFGRGSMLHQAFRSLKANNRFTESWAIALDDAAAGVAAAGSITFGGPATASGTINLYIGGRRVRASVASAGTGATIAAAAVAAINAATDLPVTAAVNATSTSKVDLTARHKGLAGNEIDIRVNYYPDEALPGGVTATIVAMSGGTGNPDIASAIAAMGDEWYSDIVMPYTDAANLAALEAELANRFKALVQMDAHAYAAKSATHANLTTLGNSRNSPHVSIIGAKGSPTLPWEWAAALCGVCAFQAKQDPARPFQTLPLDGILPPSEADRFTFEERNLLLFDGIATFTVDAGGRVLIERVTTTYEKNAFGIDDISYLDLNTLKTVAFLRYSLRARIALKYPRHKLANDGTLFDPGQAIVTPNIIRSEIIALFGQWEAKGLAEDLSQFKTDLVVERDSDDPNRVNALVPPDIVNQFRIFAARVKFLL